MDLHQAEAPCLSIQTPQSSTQTLSQPAVPYGSFYGFQLLGGAG